MSSPYCGDPIIKNGKEIGPNYMDTIMSDSSRRSHLLEDFCNYDLSCQRQRILQLCRLSLASCFKHFHLFSIELHFKVLLLIYVFACSSPWIYCYDL